MSDASPRCMVEAKDVWKVFGHRAASLLTGAKVPADGEILSAGGVIALKGATFSVARGENFIIMGLSGSGKSTLLRCLTGLNEASRGEITICGTTLTAASKAQTIQLRRHKISMVFQNFALLPHLNALDNAAFPLRVQGVALDQRRDVARRMLALVGLDGKEGRFPHELSGGQQQRVGIARSLVTDPDVWFLDEPFSALDPLIRKEMQEEFRRLQSQLHKTIVFVTHDLEEAVRLGDRIAIMAGGQILQIGTAEDLVLRPVDGYVRNFVAGIPRERVIRVGSVMAPAGPSVGSDRPVGRAATLSDVMRQVIASDDPVAVSDEGGGIVGQISRTDLAACLG